MDVSASWRKLVRAALGLDPDRETPQIDRLAHYRARVVTCAADGSTVDVQPDDARVSPMKLVPVVAGIPGAVAVVAAGAVVWIGWEAGDPQRPRAIPSWESATVTKLVLPASTVYLGAEAGAQFVALANLVNSELAAIRTSLISHTHSGVTVGVGNTGTSSSTYNDNDVSAAQVKAK